MSDPFPPPDEAPRPLRRDEPPPGADLPPIGADRDPDPTRVVPTGEQPTAGGLGDPLIGAGPATGGGGGGPDGPNGPDGPGGPGGPGDEPPYAEGRDDERPWYRQPGPLAALIAGIAAIALGLLAFFLMRSDDGTDSDDTLPLITTTTSIPATTSTVPVTEPSTSTTVPATSTTSSTTTTSSSTTTSSTTTTTSTTTSSTSTTTTTVAPTTTTAATTTTAPPTTTTAPTTTSTIVPTTTTTPPSTLPPSGPNVLQVMQTNPELTEFVEAIEANDLVDLVDGTEPVTALAPTNDFIEPAQLTADQIRLQLIPELLSEFQIYQRTTVPTLLTDQELAVDVTTFPPIVGGVTILEADIPASNGFIQVVNGATVGQPVP